VLFANSCTRYVKDILRNTSKSVDQVTIQPNGKWELHVRPEPVSKSNGVASSDDDDDLIEITKNGETVQMSTPRTYGTPAAAAVPSTREASSSSYAAPRSQGSSSTKRPIAAVIDLTSSGDEDEEPFARQPKRQYTNSSTNGFAASSTPVYRPGTGTSNRY
jgi:E3 SUMO-protein ligase PIAS1